MSGRHLPGDLHGHKLIFGAVHDERRGFDQAEQAPAVETETGPVLPEERFWRRWVLLRKDDVPALDQVSLEAGHT